MSDQKLTPQKAQQKLQIVEAMFILAYKIKRHQLEKRHSSWSSEEIHQKIIDLIARGCS